MMSFKEMLRKAKQAPKQNLVWGFGCFAGCIALVIWFIVSVVMA